VLKHIGRLKTNKRKLIVAYRTLPGDSKSCVCITTETLEAADHDSLMNLVESNAGQTAYEFAEAMARNTLSDGSNMLARFHTTGKMVKLLTTDVEMTPDTNTVISLNELNNIIATQKGVSVDDLALNTTQPKKADSVNVPTISEPTQSIAEADEVLSDEKLAANYRSQADSMFKEAKRLREEAEKLHPTKKKTTTKTGDS